MKLRKHWNAVLGLNAWGELISRANPEEAVALVDDKHTTKERLRAAGAPVPETLHLVRDRVGLRRIDLDTLPEAWACKPNQSLGGSGIKVVDGRHPDGGWTTLSGRRLPVRKLEDHVRAILGGEFSPRAADAAIFEPLLRCHPDLASLAPAGLPDIRVICDDEEPRLAMLRLPTHASDGRANLHAGGLGAAVDLATGKITRALQHRREIETHPETGERLVGVQIPAWPEVLDAASRCAAATGLHYLGADVVVDAARGPCILEVNARPGLEIQNVTGTGLSEFAQG